MDKYDTKDELGGWFVREECLAEERRGDQRKKSAMVEV